MTGSQQGSLPAHLTQGPTGPGGECPYLGKQGLWCLAPQQQQGRLGAGGERDVTEGMKQCAAGLYLQAA